MKYLLVCFFIFQLAFANELFDTIEESIFEKQAEIQAIIDEQIPSDNDIPLESEAERIYNDEMSNNEEYFTDNAEVEVEPPAVNLFEKAFVDNYFLNEKKSKNLYVSYEKFPKVVFKKQRFEVILNVIVTTDDFEKIETRFLDLKDLKIFNPEKHWEYGSENKFFNKYYFKVESKEFKMPSFQILIYKEGKVYETVTLPSKKIKYTDIATQDESFSNVIADKLEVKYHTTKQYTNNQLLTILEIESIDGNLEDFNLKYFKEQGISSMNEDYPRQTAVYYAVIPIHTKKITFDYYNTLTNKFVQIQSNVILKNELVSTQTDLNPNKSNILYYKKVASGSLALLFFILYFFRKKFILICIALIFLIIFILYNMPNEKITVKKGSDIYILPTINSTIFYKTNNIQKVELLNEKDGFFKILIKKRNENKETIGWIKEKNIVKN